VAGGGGGVFRPTEPGAYYLLAGEDTVGAISANIDPRESLLAPASDAQVRRLWRDSRVVSWPTPAMPCSARQPRAISGARSSWPRSLLALGEAALASLWRRQPQ